jgi:RNA polymerase sigma factor (TIGR02999 family)
MAGSKADVTALLRAWGHGDRDAGERLVAVVYGELRKQAARYIRRERRDHTLRPTGLVHEAYLRLAEQRDADWKNRAQFFGVAAQVMRRVLVDHARRHRAGKRGGSWQRVCLDDIGEAAAAVPRAADVDLVALVELARLDPEKARTVVLRFFGGLDIDETANVMGVSPSTVSRQWRMARAWLHRRVSGGRKRPPMPADYQE